MALILGSLTALAPLSIDMYLPSLPQLTVHFHTSASVVQLSLTCCLIGLAFGQLIAGPISDARGRRLPLCIGLTAYVGASWLCALTSSVWVLVGLRLLQGLAGSAGIVIARAIVRDHFTGRALIEFFALLMLVNGAAPVLAPVLGAQILRFTSWHGVFIVLGILGVCMLLAVMFGLPESLPPERRVDGGLRTTGTTMVSLLGDREFMGFVLAQAMVYAAMFSYISGSPFVIQNLFGASPQLFSVMFGVNGVGIIVASQLAARLSMRMGERRVLVTGLSLALLGGLALLGSVLARAGLVSVLIPLFVTVASVGLVGTTSNALAMRTKGHVAGSASGMMGVIQMLSGAVAAPIVGVAGGHNALPMGLTIATCELLANLLFWTFASRSRRTRLGSEGAL